MDVKTANDLCENEISDDLVVEIDDGCNDSNEGDNATTQLPKDSNDDRECKEAMDEHDNADCASEHVQPTGEPESGARKSQLFRIIVISTMIRLSHW